MEDVRYEHGIRQWVEFKRDMFVEFERDWLRRQQVSAVSLPPSCDRSVFDEIEAAEPDLAQVDRTTRKALVEARVGQGRYREEMMKRWSKRCSVTGCAVEKMLRASHLKPWCDSTNEERLDGNNGLLLIPNLDQAVDQRLITFDDSGSIVISRAIQTANASLLGLDRSLRLRSVPRNLLPFLRYHRRLFDEEERARR